MDMKFTYLTFWIGFYSQNGFKSKKTTKVKTLVVFVQNLLMFSNE